ncbi:MAG: tRNA 2-thiouridine(34) synthase MnmA [Coxiellaceae bacterium]|jgi:tRNA-specific 2-thiouridylase|nr:tRNA 2-thiouridine(34) synthase MnmA [Coxiellaceae bacterium]
MSSLFRKLVIVGLSGGVDSAVTAFLLKRAGYVVEAVFMKNWQDSSDESCSMSVDFKDAILVSEVLKIKLHVINFAIEYWNKVFQHFLDEYALGRTPNPDILCNKEIKFRAFLDYARSLGAEFIATGHYARKNTIDGKELLLKASDKSKDQTYFLYLLNQEQLLATIFPIGNLTKFQVREIAKNAGLPNHAKKSSTGICFIGERKFKTFLSGYLLSRPGNIVTTDNKIIGRHHGLMFYTYGQRKGICIGGQQGRPEAPWYVADKDLSSNTLIVTQEKNHSLLMSKKIICDKVHWINNEKISLPLKCQAKIRYRQLDQECIIIKDQKTNHISVEFFNAEWAVTPGQSIVFYDKDICLGGGIISSRISF